MSRIKALQEKRNALIKEADELLNVSIDEVRSLTDEEQSQYDEKMAEAAKLKKTIETIEERAAENAEVELEEKREEGAEMHQEEKRELEDLLNDEIRAVEDYIKGNVTDEVRSMTTSGGSGGITIPTHLYDQIIRKLYEVAPLFAKARRFTPVSGTLEILRESTMGEAAYVGEMTNLTPQDFSFDKVKLEQRRCGSAVELSQHLINDSGIDIVAYAKEILTKRLGFALDRSVVKGNKATEFEGLLSAPESCNVKLEGTVSTYDDYREAFNSMHLDLVGDAEWIMSRAEFNRLSKLKDQLGHYFMSADIINGKPVYKIHGLPINITDAMEAPKGNNGECVAILVNMQAAYATMVKKQAEMKHIYGDTTQSLRGSHLLLLDIYADGKIINENAIKKLVVAEE